MWKTDGPSGKEEDMGKQQSCGGGTHGRGKTSPHQAMGRGGAAVRSHAARRGLLLLLAFCLTLSPMSWGGVVSMAAEPEVPARASAQAEQGGVTVASSAAIAIAGVNVKNTDTLEVGIQVGGPDQPLFQSVGVVLEYDKSKLTPIDWEEGWQTARTQTSTSGEAIATPPAASVVGQENWRSLAVYTPTWINSGTAQVYEPSGGSGSTGGSSGSGEAGGSDSSGGSNAGARAGTGTKGAGDTPESGKGYLLLQANTEYPYFLPTARQIVTVKFRYTGSSVSGGAVTRAASFEELGLSLAGDAGTEAERQAGKNAALSSRVGHGGLYCATNDTDTQFYYHMPLKESDSGNGTAETDETLAGLKKLVVSFSEAIVEGETQQATGGGLEGVPIIFYDWDGTTLLGSAIVSTDATSKEAISAAESFQLGIADKLSDKPAYEFGCWIPFESEEPTNYGAAVSLGNVGELTEIPEPAREDFSQIPAIGLTVKAAYKAVEDELNDLNSSGAREYAIEVLYGDQINMATYSLTVRIKRKNGDRAVHCARDLALRITQITETGNAQALSLLDVPDKDETEAEIAVSTAMTSLYATVIDNGTGAVWATAGTRGQTDSIQKTGDEGFVRLGYVGLVNSYLRENQKTNITSAIFGNNGLGITLTKENVAGWTGSGNAGALRAAAQNNLQKAWKTLNGITEDVWDYEADYDRLTLNEMKNAIATGDYVPDPQSNGNI